MPDKPRNSRVPLVLLTVPYGPTDDVLAMRAVCVLFLCVIAAVLVWFYVYHDEVKSFHWSLQTMLMFVTAIAVGLAVGLALAQQIAGDAIKPPARSATQT